MGQHISQEKWDAKYNLFEFLSMQEAGDLSWVDFYKEKLPLWLSAYDGKHVGDCTKVPCSCCLCCAQRCLEDYYNYFFDKGDDPSVAITPSQ